MIPVFSHGLLKLTVLGKLKLCDIAARSKVKKTNHLKGVINIKHGNILLSLTSKQNTL